MVLLCRGRSVTLDEICSASLGEFVEVCEESYDAVARARASYEAATTKGEVYGYEGGLGALAEVKQERWPGRERVALAEHDTSVGPEAPREFVRAAMTVRASQLSQGSGPVRPSVLRRIVDALNHDIVPVVGLQGSVGASGDLAPLARIARCLFYGEGMAMVRGQATPCSEAIKPLGGTLELQPGEALALINSNAWSVGIAALGVCAAQRLVRASIVVASHTLEVTGCNPQHFSVAVASVKGPSAREAIELLGSPCSRTPRLQDPYSIRCIPQVYGASLEALAFARGVIEREASSPSENPFVWDGSVYHACNFHAAPASLAADTAKLALASVGNSIERRTAQVLRASVTGLPAFLAAKESVVGAMIYQYTAASLAARLRSLSAPSSVHSLPTSELQEDVVSMAPNAAVDLVAADAVLLRLIAVEEALSRAAKRVAAGNGLPDPPENIREAIDYVAQLAGLDRFTGLLSRFW